MRKAEVDKALASGQRTFVANVSGNRTTVRILGESLHGGWNAENTATGREVRIRTAARLHGVAR
jgi:hypothetical protein